MRERDRERKRWRAREGSIISAFMSLEKGLAVLSTLLIQERVEQRLKPGFQRPDALFLTFSMLPHLK